MFVGIYIYSLFNCVWLFCKKITIQNCISDFATTLYKRMFFPHLSILGKLKYLQQFHAMYLGQERCDNNLLRLPNRRHVKWFSKRVRRSHGILISVLTVIVVFIVNYLWRRRINWKRKLMRTRRTNRRCVRRFRLWRLLHKIYYVVF